jgi:hypothetical protein
LGDDHFPEGKPMSSWLESAWGLVLDLPARLTVEGIMVSLFLAGGTACLYRVLRRGKSETLSLLTTLILMGNVLVMVAAATTVRRSFGMDKIFTYAGSRVIMPSGLIPELRPRPTLAERVFRATDANQDGRLTPDEASRAAAEFVKQADENHEGSISPEAFEAAMRKAGWAPPPPGSRGRR